MPATTVSQPVFASGAPDGDTPGWTIHTAAPAGWTADCCTYAKAIGVNFVLYQGDWSGEPNRVMVLNVWPRELPSLDAETRADRNRYLARDPAAKVGSFPVRHRTMQCAATVFQGTDHVDDVVVFCDPGKITGIRLSWSMSFADGDPTRRVLLNAFMRVVVNARYMRHEQAAAGASHFLGRSFTRKREPMLPFASSNMDDRPLLRSTLRTVGFADVRFGIAVPLSRECRTRRRVWRFLPISNRREVTSARAKP